MADKQCQIIFLILALIFQITVEGRSMYGIGMRITGDKMLVKDALRAPTTLWPRNQTILFNYSIHEPITYIEIGSDNNVRADIKFSYQDDLVEGTITSFNTMLFEVSITIFGFDKTMLGVTSFTLNKDVEFEGSLELSSGEEEQDEDIDTQNAHDEIEIDADESDNSDESDRTIANDRANHDYEYEDGGYQDYTIRIGRRQYGDYKIFEMFQDSPKTDEPSNHSVTFYYIDDKVITSAEFTVFDSAPSNSPIAEHSFLSPHTLKATISDIETTSIFVQMNLYGYEPADLPVDFVSVLPTSPGSFSVLGKQMVDDNEECDCNSGSISVSQSLSFITIAYGIVVGGLAAFNFISFSL